MSSHPKAVPSRSSPPLTGPVRVCVIGLGYIGLPTSAVLVSRGHTVHGVDVSPETRETINSGRAHIVEPDLDMLVRAGIESGRLRAHSSRLSHDPARPYHARPCKPPTPRKSSWSRPRMKRSRAA